MEEEVGIVSHKIGGVSRYKIELPELVFEAMPRGVIEPKLIQHPSLTIRQG
jgi:hypothetical protein